MVLHFAKYEPKTQGRVSKNNLKPSLLAEKCPKSKVKNFT